MIDALGLACEKCFDGFGELRMRQPVYGRRLHRHQTARHCEPLALKRRRKAWRPAAAIKGAAGFVEGMQELVLQERIAAGETVPLRGVNSGQRGYNFNGQG